jgi:anthranilate synthase component 2
VMGFQHVSRPVFGVQFHPESIATEGGHALLANFLDLVGVKRASIA